MLIAAHKVACVSDRPFGLTGQTFNKWKMRVVCGINLQTAPHLPPMLAHAKGDLVVHLRRTLQLLLGWPADSH